MYLQTDILSARPKDNSRGAALVVALAVLVILSVIALTFFTLSMQELKTATNLENQVRAELIANGGTALAVAFLNYDLMVHPTFTSLDHSWRTYFNGSWAAGKRWAWKDGIPPIRREFGGGGGVPEIEGKDSLKPAMYIPRWFPETDAFGEWPDFFEYLEPGVHPFVVTSDVSRPGALPTDKDYSPLFPNEAVPLLPAEQIHRFADVDSDGDGLRDAVWIPVPADVLFGGRDTDDDGNIDVPGDGLDNNLNGFVDEPGEIATFVYWAGNDGRDNNRNGLIDENLEQRVFLTAPLVYANGVDHVAFEVLYNAEHLAAWAGLAGINSSMVRVDATTIDLLDNDWDLVVNNNVTAHDPNIPLFDALYEIAGGYLNNDTRMASSGEPVCEVIGRVAVLVTDEASKVNLNAAGGRSFNKKFLYPPLDEPGPHAALARSLNEGVGPYEYDTRVLPGIGPAYSDHLWSLLTGAQGGMGFVSGFGYDGLVPGDPAGDGSRQEHYSYAYDLSLPGYGFVDDNGDAIWLAMNGLDDDGDGIVDEGFNPLYPELFGQFEGVDEPGELQRYRPLRNKIAEEDLENNDPIQDKIRDEIGEFGDRNIKTREQFKMLTQRTYPDANTERFANGAIISTSKGIKNLTTVHSTDKNLSFDHNIWPVAGVSGTKLDYNYATAEQIAEALKQDWPEYGPRTFFGQPAGIPQSEAEALGFGLGLSTSAVYMTENNKTILGGLTNHWPISRDYSHATWGEITGVDGELKADQIAVNIKDNRDTDHARTEITTEVEDDWWKALQEGARVFPVVDRPITYTSSGMESIRINEIMVRPVRRVEAEMQFFDDPANPGSGPSKLAVGTNAYIGLHPSPPNPLPPALPDPRLNLPTFSMKESDFGDLYGPGFSDWRLYFSWSDLWSNRVPLGDKVAYATTFGRLGGGDNEGNIAVRNDMIQFRFRATDGLPPGRYYLVVNTTMDGTAQSATVTGSDQMEYAIKYRVAGAGQDSILTDVDKFYGSNFTLPDAVWRNVEDTYIGRDGNGQATGYVFLPNTNPSNNPGYNPGPGHTVEIHNFSTTRIELLVAFRRIPDLNEDDEYDYNELAVNFFDFSQEPDHEWIEIVNIEELTPLKRDKLRIIAQLNELLKIPPRDPSILDEVDRLQSEVAIDLGGWRIEVKQLEESVGDAGRLYTYTVPPNTFIAPNGSLILGVNKFDDYNNFVEPIHPDQSQRIYHNGIGLARGVIQGGPSDLTYYTDVTVPPVPNLYAARLLTPSPSVVYGNALAFGESVFDRSAITRQILDLIAAADTNGDNKVSADEFNVVSPNDPSSFKLLDSDGDGFVFISQFAFGDDYRKYLDYVDYDGDSFPDLSPDDVITSVEDRIIATYGLSSPTKAWDRIVELESSELQSVKNVNQLAEWILKGGIFPNYPEHDGIDNDDDNDVLNRDGVDNNGNVFGRPGGFDKYGVRYPISGSNIGTIPANLDDTREGFDEGRHRLNMGQTTPGSYKASRASLNTTNGDKAKIPRLCDANRDGLYSGVRELFWTDYLGSTDNPPDWKAFEERRFFPGDCVIVKLKDNEGRVVDSVTYSERDVINSSIDDVKVCPYRAWPPPESTLDRRYPTFWLDNSMAFDFYKSLERKHPQYAGDRLGTQNRWEATDGNYDDWAAMPSRWRITPTGNLDYRLGTVEKKLIYGHALSASPLRKNFSQRIAEYIARPGSPRPLQIPVSPYNGENPFDVAGFREWSFDKAAVRNRPYASPGDLVTLASLKINEKLLSPPLYPATQSFRTLGKETIVGIMAGQARKIDLDAVMSGTINTSIVLTAGLADFYPMWPLPTGILDSEVMWGDGSAGPIFPEAWSPVFLYSLDKSDKEPYTSHDWPPRPWANIPELTSDNAYRDGTEPEIFPHFTWKYEDYPFQMNFLFEPPVLPIGLDATVDLLPRWPLQNRAVMYVSGNTFDFESRRDDVKGAHVPAVGTEALFVWDGADGLENGEYDLYIALNDDMSMLDDAFTRAIQLRIAFLTQFGFDFKQRLDSTILSDVIVDVEVFTDRNNDVKSWAEFDDMPMIGLPGSGATSAALVDNLDPADSFGMLQGAQPGTDGYLHYGVVRVENNFLALRLRNWSKQDQLIRFSRVILTPRKRTPGRINANTVVTRTVDKAPDSRTFNALNGVPGILAFYDLSTQLESYLNDPAAPTRQDYIDWLFGTGSNPNADVLRRAGQVANQRPEWPDGRYYKLVSDMVINPWTQRYSESLGHDQDSMGPVPEEFRFNELLWRYQHMGNMVTTRSDVFEIIVTAQTGHISNTDENGDGRIDYRNDFIVMGETKTRQVYER